MKHPKSTRSDGYIQEHRLIIEEYFGRDLRSGEDVHHINGNKQDNRLTNLVVMDRGVHMRMHALENYQNRERDDHGRFK